MRVIHVHFDTVKNSVTVLPAAEVVFAGDEVVWEVTSAPESMMEVKLEGNKDLALFFFEGFGIDNPSQRLVSQRTRIRGVAPHVEKGATARYEYTVIGTRGNGNLIQFDPVIIIVPPEPMG